MKKKDFKKKDLKTGMLVELVDGRVYMVVGFNIIRSVGFCGLAGYSEDLTFSHSISSDCDIKKVSHNLIGHELRVENWTKETVSNNLLWERKEDTPDIDKRIKKKAKKIRKAIKFLSKELRDSDIKSTVAHFKIYDNGQCIIAKGDGFGEVNECYNTKQVAQTLTKDTK